MKNPLRLAFAAILGSVLVNCDLNSAPEIAYLEVDTMLVNAKNGEGTSSSKLTTLWIEQDGEQIGAFTPPCRIPVYARERTTVRSIPGINLNGTFSQRNQYEMLSPNSVEWDLAPGSTKSVAPIRTTFEYNPNYTLEILEDFDDVGLNYVHSVKSDTVLLLTDLAGEAFEYPGEWPNKSGKYVLPPSTRGEFKTLKAFELPKFGANVWMEINYKTDVALTFGVYANQQLQSIQAPVVTLFPNEEWNKVYINLVTEVSGYPNAIDYNLFFGSINTSQDTTTTYIDNIKLLY
jgi:hypothetical protein